MLAIFNAIESFIVDTLLQPIADVIDTIVAIICNFLDISYFIGYCLFQVFVFVWKKACAGYQWGTLIVKEFKEAYSDFSDNVLVATDYIQDSTIGGLRLGGYLLSNIFLFISNILIELGNITLWILLLLPRAIIFVLDHILQLLTDLSYFIVENGILLLNNLFKLSIGIAVLLILFTFRRYVTLYIQHILRVVKIKYFRAWRWSCIYTKLSFDWLIDAFKRSQRGVITPSTPNCVICLERSRNIVLLPCRHLCLCKECLREMQLYESANHCPICRNFIESTIPIYS